MPIVAKKLKDRTNTLKFSYMDETMQVEYKPAEVTTGDFFTELEQLDDADESLLFQLQRAIVRWELVDEAGQPLEITLELVRSIERPFWFSLIQAINQDMKSRLEAKKA